MIEVSSDQLRATVEAEHGVKATLLQSVSVRETFRGGTVWAGMVHVFKLEGHARATRAYAWSYTREDGAQRFFAILDLPPIMSPVDAVRAAMVAEQRAS